MKKINLLFLALFANTFILYAQIAYYPFNGNVNDASSNGYNLNNVSVSFGNDKNGTSSSAASFNGTTSWLQTSNFLAGKDSATISLWVKSNASTQKGLLVYVGNSNLNGYGLVVDMCNTVNPGNNISMLCGGVRWLCNNTITLGTAGWVHVAMVKAGRNYKLFINGNAVHSDTCSMLSPSDYFCVGGNHISTGGNTFNGLIDEVKVFDQSFSDAQVNLLYTGTSGIKQAVASLSCYPNPVQPGGQIHVISIDESRFENATIYDLNGKKLDMIQLNRSGYGSWPLALSSGFHLLKLADSKSGFESYLKILVTP
jgi:hypothetical protein